MAARPDVPGWERNNDEYSSRFTLPNTINSGIKFATVVNVRTGQRQLYQETLFGRNLLKTTNSNGSIVPPNEQTKKNLSLFNLTYSNSEEILAKAEKSSKQASIIVINEASTPEEKENLKKTKEFKSGLNTEKQDPNNNEGTQISFPTDNVSTKTPVEKGTAITYPIDIEDTQQDRIKFTAVSLAERTIQNPLEYKTVGGDVYVSIQGPIADSNVVGWGDSKIGPIESVAFKLGKELLGDEGEKSVKKEIESQLGQLKGEISNVIASQAAGGNMDLFTRASQKVFNPNLELIFKEPKLRQFSFSFKMSARSDTEAENIKKIIKYFKYHMAVKGKGGDLFLKAPDVFWIEYQKGKGKTPHESLNLIAPGKIKSKACALQSFNVNYTPLGTYMTYDDKECTMVQYDLQFAFSEITPLYQSDYEDKFVADHPIGY